MPNSEDYRKYLEEKFNGFHSLMDAQFIIVNDKLELIHNEAKKTNGRINKLEEYKDYAQKVIDRRPTECPNLEKMNKTEDRIEILEKKLEDAMFFVRHPKLFIGVIVFFVLMSLATFLKDGMFQMFQRKTNTEMIK
jgi:hypothetical protein